MTDIVTGKLFNTVFETIVFQTGLIFESELLNLGMGFSQYRLKISKFSALHTSSRLKYAP